MVFGDEFVEGDGFKLVLLWGRFSEHGGQSIFYPDLIRSKSRLFSQDFVSNLRPLCGLFFFCSLMMHLPKRDAYRITEIAQVV
ncbi:hypothetical protein DC667_15535 [Salmonella enterica]|nr:hypothetical protein [Salmonella enterica]EDC7504847.1 hypothetical protein [Salmonella enterica subsp. enterica serovar Virchow]EDC7584641.1 hypothetical protein [Salmonella enterica subsp. enterica serovar Virchow]EDD6050635.1 hypothetical protein [Salmonella enterica]